MSGLPSLQSLLFSDSSSDGCLATWEAGLDWQEPLHYPPPPSSFLGVSPPNSINSSSSSAASQLENLSILHSQAYPPKPTSEKGSPDSADSSQKKSASDRERSRMKDMNLAFDKLRSRLQHMKQQGKRLSKIQALRSAIQYIEDLEHVLLYADCTPESSQFYSTSSNQPYYNPPFLKSCDDPCSWPPNPSHTPPPSDFSPFHALNHQ